MIFSQKISRPSPTFQLRSFLKNIENFLCKQKIVNNHSIPSTHALRKLPIFLINILLLYIPLLALTDRQNYIETNTLAARGLEELFFQLCCRVSFWFWWEIGFGLHTYVLRVPYSCGVVSVFVLLVGNSFWYVRVYHTVVVLCQFFWFWREIDFGITYVYSVQYSCAVVFLKNDYSVSLFLEK